MDPDTILRALMSMATAPGEAPPGAERYSNPYGWSPVTDRSMAPLMQSSQTVQMIGAMAPMIMNMVDPKLASRLGMTSNIHPGFRNQALQMQEMQLSFSRAQSAHQTEAIGRLGTAIGADAETMATVTKFLPIAGMVMPELGNALSRFDVSGAGFGYDAAMMSMVKAGGLNAGRVDPHSAEYVAKHYAESYQREGVGGLAGVKVIDSQKTGGLSIAEMGQLRAGLANRGIVEDVYAGLNDVQGLRRNMSAEDQLKTKDAKTMTDLRAAVGSDVITGAREKTLGANMDRSKDVEKEYAKAIHTMGSVFTTMQGDTEGLLHAIETLHGPLSKLENGDLDKTMTKFIDLLDKSGMQAEELLKGAEVFMARTGTADRQLAVQTVARAGGARSNLAAGGVAEADAMRISSDTADIVGAESQQNVAMFATSMMTEKGVAAVKRANEVVADKTGKYSAEEVDASRRFLHDPRETKEKGLIKEGMQGAIDELTIRARGGHLGKFERTELTRKGAEAMGMDLSDYAEMEAKATAGILGHELDATITNVAATPEGKKSFDALKKKFGVTGAKAMEMVADAATAASEGMGESDALALATGRGYKGKAAIEYAERIVGLRYDAEAGGAVRGVGTISRETARRHEAGVVGGIDPDQAKSRGLDEIREQIKQNGTITAATPREAIIGLMESTKDRTGKDRDWKDFAVAGFQAIGVLGAEQKLTPKQIEEINKSGWKTQYDDIMKGTDEKVKADKLQMLTSDMQQALHLGNRAMAETYLAGDDGRNALFKAAGEAKGSEQLKEKAAPAAVKAEVSGKLIVDVNQHSDGTSTVTAPKEVALNGAADANKGSETGSKLSNIKPPPRK